MDDGAIKNGHVHALVYSRLFLCLSISHSLAVSLCLPLPVRSVHVIIELRGLIAAASLIWPPSATAPPATHASSLDKVLCKVFVVLVIFAATLAVVVVIARSLRLLLSALAPNFNNRHSCCEKFFHLVLKVMYHPTTAPSPTYPVDDLRMYN